MIFIDEFTKLPSVMNDHQHIVFLPAPPSHPPPSLPSLPSPSSTSDVTVAMNCTSGDDDNDHCNKKNNPVLLDQVSDGVTSELLTH